MLLQRLSDNETGITDEPDLTLVSGVTSTDISSLSPEKSIVTTPGRSTSGSSSLLSFEQHERSLLDQATPQTLRKPSQSIELIAVSGGPARDRDNSKNTKTGRDAKAVGVRFLLPTENASQCETVDIIPGICFVQQLICDCNSIIFSIVLRFTGIYCKDMLR